MSLISKKEMIIYLFIYDYSIVTIQILVKNLNANLNFSKTVNLLFTLFVP